MGSQLPPPKRATAPPVFGSCLLWPNGWMDEDTTCMAVDLGPGHIVLDWVLAPRETGTAAPPLFGPCLLWPRSPISATAELLFVFIVCCSTFLLVGECVLLLC